MPVSRRSLSRKLAGRYINGINLIHKEWRVISQNEAQSQKAYFVLDIVRTMCYSVIIPNSKANHSQRRVPKTESDKPIKSYATVKRQTY